MWYETYDGKLLNLNQFDFIDFNEGVIEFWKNGEIVLKDQSLNPLMTYGTYLALRMRL